MHTQRCAGSISRTCDCGCNGNLHGLPGSYRIAAFLDGSVMSSACPAMHAADNRSSVRV